MKTKKLINAFYVGNRLLFFVVLVLIVLISFDGVVVSWLLGEITDAAAEQNYMELVFLLKLVVSYVFAVFVLDAATKRLRCRFQQRANENYKNAAFSCLTKKQIGAFHGENSARYLALMTGDATTVSEQYLMSTFDILRDGVMFAAAMSAMFLYRWWVALVILGFCVLPVLTVMLLGKSLERAQRVESNENERFIGILKDMLSGFSVIKAFRAETAVENQFRQANEVLEEKKFEARWALSRLVAVGYSFFYPAMQFGIFFLMAFLTIMGKTTVGMVLYFTNLANFIVQPIQEIPQLLAKRKAARGLIEKLAEFLEENTETERREEKAELQDAIYIKDLCFSYDDKPVLKHLNLRLEKGR